MTTFAPLAAGVFCALVAGAVFGMELRVSPVLADRARNCAAARRTWLQQAHAGVTPAQFRAGSIAAGGLALLVVRAVTGSWFVGAVPAVAVSLLPRAYFGRQRAKRLQRVQAAWPDGLRDLLASIAAGHSLGQAVSALAQTGPEPLREAFARFPQLSHMLGTTAALDVIKDELADPTSDRVLEVLMLANERGGGIVRSILEDLVSATTKDLKLLEQIETEGLEMRINARAVVVMPWLVLVFLTMSAGPFRDFYQSSRGLVTLLVGGALTLGGLALLNRLGRRTDEPRVLGGAS